MWKNLEAKEEIQVPKRARKSRFERKIVRKETRKVVFFPFFGVFLKTSISEYINKR